MADSKLAAQVKASPPSNATVWDRLEAAVEVIYTAIITGGGPTQALAQSAASPTNTAGTPFTVLTADGTVFTLAAGERGYIQNLDTDPLCWKRGASCSSTSFTGKLPACSIADDATSPPLIIKDWIGIVSVAASTGSPRYVASKI